MRTILFCCLLLTFCSPGPARGADWKDWRRWLDSGNRPAVEQARANFIGMHQRAVAENNHNAAVFARLYRALCDFYLGRRTRAKADLERLIEKYPESGLLVLVHGELGKLYQIEWQTKQAHVHLTKALHLASKAQSLKPVDVARFRLSRAVNLVIAGDNDAAKEELEAVRKSVGSLPADDARSIKARCDGQLAELDYRNISMSSAIGRLQNCVKEMRAVARPTRATIEDEYFCRMGLANKYRELTRFRDAERELAAAEGLLETKDGRGKRILGSIYFNRHREELGNTRANLQLEWARNDFEAGDSGKGVMARLAASRQAAESASHWHAKVTKDQTKETADTWSKLAAIDMVLGRMFAAKSQPEKSRSAFARSEAAFTSSIELFEKLLEDETHDAVLELRRDRATVLSDLGNGRSALDEARLLLPHYETRYGRNSLQSAQIHQLLISLETVAGNLRQAVEHADAHRRIINEHALVFLAGLTPGAQQSFSRRWNEPGLHAGLRLAIDHPDDEQLTGLSAEWLLNGKAKSAELLAYAGRQARDLELADDFRRKIERQAYLLYGSQQRDETDRLLALESEKREIVERRVVEKARLGALKIWYPLDALRRELESDEAFIDVFAGKDATTSRRGYYAWIVMGGESKPEPVQIVRLGDAAEIDELTAKLVDRFEGETEALSLRTKPGVAEAEQRLRKQFLEPISKQIFQPVWRAVGDRRRWIISPDGALWSLPWAALIVPGTGDYAVEHLTIRYVISARDVVLRGEKRAGVGPAVVIAEPALNWRGPHKLGELRPDPLFEFKDEGRDVFGILRAGGVEAELNTRRDATKDKVLQARRTPRVLYLSTHGGFLAPGRRRVDDPFLCCYVALAGYNILPAAASPAAGLPGVLTGAEVLTADLRETELVVLSACQTGRGISTYGHSAASLRHAFHLAGAGAVTSSLWSVSTEPTNRLMTRFMSEAQRSGSNKAEALRSAQIWMVEKLREGHFGRNDPAAKYHAHPYLWAAFSVSGF